MEEWWGCILFHGSRKCFYILLLSINGWSGGLGTKRGLGIMARRMKKSNKKWIWVAKPGDKIVVSRTAVIPSKQLSRRSSEP
jgi:hypothetical protein